METCKIELCGGEAFSDAHGCAATGTVPEIAVGGRRQRQRFAALRSEQGARQGQQLFSETVRQQAVVADAHETPGQDMEEEAPQELDGTEGHDTLDGGDAIVSIASRLPRYGVTAFCPTTVACGPAELRAVLDQVGRASCRERVFSSV